MKENHLKRKGKSGHCVIFTPLPEFLTCPKCGEDIELWSDDRETACIFCGHRVFKKETTVH